MTKIVRGEGAYLYTADGHRIIDAIASWWVVTHGHCHPNIVSAIQKQAEQLNQIIFLPATLTNRLKRLLLCFLKLVPRGLDYVFFSDSGSTSVEVALKKMALGYWHNMAKPRTRIVVMQHSYHGDTVGTMSVGARGVFNAAYEPLLFDVTSVPFPTGGHEQAALDALEIACRTENPAAFIVEPLILGAGGMLMYPAWVLKEMKRICEASDVLFIADEVMTGWGRTGTLFACEQADVSPDIACYSKGLTGGSLPLAVTLCRADIFRRALFERSYAHVLSLEFVYGESSGECRRKGEPRSLAKSGI
ncbi:aminotransferase class III-fold pyridoxal phosphate-dependent enzyme [Ancylobacter dichloromethanicus]